METNGIRWKLMCYIITFIVSVGVSVSGYTLYRVNDLASKLQGKYIERAEYQDDREEIRRSLDRIEARLDKLAYRTK